VVAAAGSVCEAEECIAVVISPIALTAERLTQAVWGAFQRAEKVRQSSARVYPFGVIQSQTAERVSSKISGLSRKVRKSSARAAQLFQALVVVRIDHVVSLQVVWC